ncbi:MAG TPA: hypothetical protein VJ785_06650, partial [Anaerolineales bacterium]|nr:hypothetical protein [Anaerolineales bacterium]
MILQSFLTFALAVCGGFGLAHLLWADSRAWAVLVKFFLGIGIGLGITSCLYFLRLLFLAGQAGYLLIQAGFFVLILLALFFRDGLSFNASFKISALSRWQIFLSVAWLLVLSFTAYYLILSSRNSPHGDYDAQAIWNLRARFIYRLGNDWENAFLPNINRNFHMDYPLLVPLNVVGGWNTLHGEVLRIPAVQSMLFLMGLAGLTYSALAYMRTSSQASMGMIVLLATPLVLLFSTFQTADIPLSYFFLASVILFLLARQQDSNGLLFLCGLMAGLSAWTKNEGLPFALVIAASVLVTYFHGRGHKGIISFFAGMALPLLSTLLFKILVPASNDLLVDNGILHILQNISDPGRYGSILLHLKSELAQLGGWPVSILLLLTCYGILMGANISTRNVHEVCFLLIVVAAQFFTYMLVYLITP